MSQLRFTIGRERTMENKPYGEESGACWHICNDGKPLLGPYMFVTRYRGQQIYSEEEAKFLAQTIADKMNADEWPDAT